MSLVLQSMYLKQIYGVIVPVKHACERAELILIKPFFTQEVQGTNAKVVRGEEDFLVLSIFSLNSIHRLLTHTTSFSLAGYFCGT